MGKRGQRAAALHAKGLCIWCEQPNPDLSKMGCRRCLPIRAAKTAEYRARKRARERATVEVGEEEEEGEDDDVEEEEDDAETEEEDSEMEEEDARAQKRRRIL